MKNFQKLTEFLRMVDATAITKLLNALRRQHGLRTYTDSERFFNEYAINSPIDAATAIDDSIVWSETPDGVEYWDWIFNQLVEMEQQERQGAWFGNQEILL